MPDTRLRWEQLREHLASIAVPEVPECPWIRITAKPPNSKEAILALTLLVKRIPVYWRAVRVDLHEL
jgi:hypothetical protein